MGFEVWALIVVRGRIPDDGSMLSVHGLAWILQGSFLGSQNPQIFGGPWHRDWNQEHVLVKKAAATVVWLTAPRL